MAEIRIRNVTGVDLDSVTVTATGPSGPSIRFGRTPDGGSTEYRDLPGVRAVVSIDAVAADAHFTLRPYDDVGEPRLPAGRYTFELGLAGGAMSLSVLRDDREGVD